MPLFSHYAKCLFSHDMAHINFCIFEGDVLLKPIVANAGLDISHWFNPKTKDVSCISRSQNI